MKPPDIIVVGGGLAGIAASVALSRRGVRVVLIESSLRLGGRAASYDDPRTGETIDNCQHVALGCCTNYRSLLDDIDAADALEWSDTQWWVESGGRMSTFRRAPLPAPLDGLPSLLSAAFLDGPSKAAIAQAMPRLISTPRGTFAGVTFAHLLSRLKQPAIAVRRFWEPIIVSACNASVQTVAASIALHVIQDGVAGGAPAGRIGVPRLPLSELYSEVPAALTGAGGRVLMRTRVEALSRNTVTIAGGEVLPAAAVICALPPDRVARVVSLDDAARDARFAALDSMPFSPIVGVHLRFDRPIMPMPHAALVEQDVQWVFRNHDDPHRLHAVISAADEWTELDEQAIVDRVTSDIRSSFPEASAAELTWARVVKSRRATFLADVRSEAIRPDAAGESGIVLAGDATRTGWPATMEGAVRSGRIAAAAAIGAPAQAFLTSDTPTPILNRLVQRVGGILIGPSAAEAKR